MEKNVLSIETLLNQFEKDDFHGTPENVKALINLTKDLGVEVDLGVDAINKVMEDLDDEIGKNETEISALKENLRRWEEERRDLELKKLRLTTFVEEMRDLGIIEKQLSEEDPF
jgi:chromosome segregation ATPase